MAIGGGCARANSATNGSLAHRSTVFKLFPNTLQIRFHMSSVLRRYEIRCRSAEGSSFAPASLHTTSRDQPLVSVQSSVSVQPLMCFQSQGTVLSLLDYVRISGPYYHNSDNGFALFPFVVADGELDIAPLNFSEYASAPLMDTDINIHNLPLYRFLGETATVAALGPKFIRYINLWRKQPVDSPVTVHAPGTMTKVQASDKRALYTGAVYRITPDIPLIDIPNGTSWVFKSPLTITTVENGVTQYITFNTTLY